MRLGETKCAVFREALINAHQCNNSLPLFSWQKLSPTTPASNQQNAKLPVVRKNIFAAPVEVSAFLSLCVSVCPDLR